MSWAADNGVFRTINNGVSWTPSGLSGGIYALALSGNTILATSINIIFRSADMGISWDTINTGLTGASINSIVVNGSNIYLGAGAKGVFRSTNNGISWDSANIGLPVDRYIMSMAASGNNIFAGTISAGIFISTDNGTNWKAINSGLPDKSYVRSIAVSGSSILVGLFGSNAGVYLSYNNGESWNSKLTISSGLSTIAGITSFAINGNAIFASDWGGGHIFLSTNNGANWRDVGLNNACRINCLVINAKNILAGTDSWPSDVGGSVWHRPLSELVGIIKNQSKIVAFSQNDFTISLDQPNQNLTIVFSLPHFARTSFKIYNVSGKEIVTFFNNNFSSDLHKLSLDIRNLASGFYTVRMQAGSNSYVKSILISR
jgi:photosystem II stability/assembly factor-like uncharacterized protein